MANLIPAALKASATQAMKDVFDSFKRAEQITVYKTPSREVVIQDPDFIAGFQESRQETTSIIESSVSESFDARIWYLDYQPLEGMIRGDGDTQVKLKYSWGRVKLQVELDGYNYLKDAKRIWLYDEKHTIDEDFRRIGILGEIQFYQCILKKVS